MIKSEALPSVTVACVLCIFTVIGCKGTDGPTAPPQDSSAPPPIAVQWDNLPASMVVSNREYLGFTDWSEPADGRIGRMHILNPTNHTDTIFAESTVYIFKNLRMQAKAQSYVFISDQFKGNSYQTVYRALVGQPPSKLFWLPEGDVQYFSLSPTGHVAHLFSPYTGWAPNPPYRKGIWIDSKELFTSRTHPTVTCGSPCWSADGQSMFIPFDHGSGSNPVSGIYRVNVQDTSYSLLFGASSQALLEKMDSSRGSPSFDYPELSSDGMSLTSEITYTDRAAAYVQSLWLMAPDGSNAHEIVRMPGNGCLRWPRFSPDGGTIAFMWENDIWLVKTDGSGLVQVVTGGWIESFDWMPK